MAEDKERGRGGGGGLRKSRKIEEEEEEEEEMEEGNALVTKLDLPPGCREYQKLKEHAICLANHTNSNECF